MTHPGRGSDAAVPFSAHSGGCAPFLRTASCAACADRKKERTRMLFDQAGFGLKLYEIRKKYGMTQEQMSNELHISIDQL